MKKLNLNPTEEAKVREFLEEWASDFQGRLDSEIIERAFVAEAKGVSPLEYLLDLSTISREDGPKRYPVYFEDAFVDRYKDHSEKLHELFEGINDKNPKVCKRFREYQRTFVTSLVKGVSIRLFYNIYLDVLDRLFKKEDIAHIGDYYPFVRFS